MVDFPIEDSRPDSEGMPFTFGSEGSSVLATLALSIDRLPRVELRKTELGPGRCAGDATSAGDRITPGGGAERIQLFGELGHGGMGVVLKGHDNDLGRDLAIKVLREQFRDQPDMVRRFIEEAQIAGQLQHPGVVPVYELGSLADRRPYIAMRLVEGHTLAELLRARAGPADELPRLMGIFESVCQTMAYAHARGVIHRDLKPSNIMVGAFGEVQVMDWGLAKILTRQGPADEESDAAESEGMPERRPTGIAVARHEFVGDRSRPGSVLGTPAYMAPEQARGEVELLDERSDVFALGSILCEVLTGRPAFTGANSDEIERRSARGDVAEAIGRLDACGADRKLAGLAAECLAAEPTGRPRDARELAERVTAHRIGVQEQLHAAELAKVHAQAQAAEEGRRRRLTIALAASVLALVVFGGGASTWLVYQRQTGLARVAVALKEIELLRNQAVDDPGDVSKWHAARAAMQHARDLMDTVPAGLGRSRLRELDDQIENGARAAEEDRTLVTRLEEIRVRLDADQRADAAYTEAFAAAGLDLSSPGLDPVDIG